MSGAKEFSRTLPGLQITALQRDLPTAPPTPPPLAQVLARLQTVLAAENAPFNVDQAARAGALGAAPVPPLADREARGTHRCT